MLSRQPLILDRLDSSPGPCFNFVQQMRFSCNGVLGVMIAQCAVITPSMSTVFAMLPSMMIAAEIAPAAGSVAKAVERKLNNREIRTLQDDSDIEAAAFQSSGASQACAQIARRGQCAEYGYAVFCPDECASPGQVSNATDTTSTPTPGLSTGATVGL